MTRSDSPWEYVVNYRSGQFASICMWSAMREAWQMHAVWQAWLRSLTSGGLMWHWRLFSWTENIILMIQINFLLLQGDLVTVHPIHERDPVPLAVHHHPVTTTFAMFQVWSLLFIIWHLWFAFQMAGSTETLTVCEPGRLEEDVMMGKMVIGVNAYREVCTLHLAGQVKFYLWVGVGT